MTAIALGSSGFIGRALVRRLERDGEHVIGHSSATLDLRRSEALDQLTPHAGSSTTLFLVAALTPEHAVGLPGLADNLSMLFNVSSFVERTPFRKVVYFSSDAVYAIRPEPLHENSPIDVSSLYALAKLNGERMLEHSAGAAGIPLLCLRVTGVYGPSDPHNAYGPNRFVRAIAEGRPVPLFGEGEERRDHIFVDDVAQIAASLAASEAVGVFNVATGTSRTFASIVDDLRAVAPGPLAVEHRPRSGPITHRSFDIARLTATLPGLAFTPFLEGLRRSMVAAIPSAIGAVV